ncbi:MAG: tetratricopeptide repeat protein [Alphaproteobacteria bacterium]|nr:tetratricopeptide repeat protein [Alphaproteobacteria bacterium]
MIHKFSFTLLVLLTGWLTVSVTSALADQGKELFDSGRYQEAVSWWKQASETHQDHEAEFRLGDYYESGGVEPENLPEAAKWYAMAAEGGHPGAQFALGSFLEAGAGGEQSIEKAAYWYGRCAARNVANCQFNLGRLYSSGEAGKQDLVEAYKWYYLSAKNGFLEFDAEELVMLAARLTSEQKREAVKRAIAFKPEQ